MPLAKPFSTLEAPRPTAAQNKALFLEHPRCILTELTWSALVVLYGKDRLRG